jgi:hypothetical protein
LPVQPRARDIDERGGLAAVDRDHDLDAAVEAVAQALVVVQQDQVGGQQGFEEQALRGRARVRAEDGITEAGDLVAPPAGEDGRAARAVEGTAENRIETTGVPERTVDEERAQWPAEATPIRLVPSVAVGTGSMSRRYGSIEESSSAIRLR